MSARTFWTFTLTFWLLADAMLFISALQVPHWNQVVYRFFFIPLLGVLICSALVQVYQSDGFRKLRRPLLWVALASFVSSLTIAMTVNLITYLLLGLDVSRNIGVIVHGGTLLFSVLFFLWSFIYFQLDARPLLGVPGPAMGPARSYLDTLSVEHRGLSRDIRVADVEYFGASGDYVEIQLPEHRFLHRGTITALEKMLDPAMFRRVHRSAIVNRDRVSAINPRGSGAYELCFPSGHSVNSSRSYLSVVQELQVGN